MSTIVSVHSFRGGTGKSNTTANVAALLAGEGQHVAVVDTDIQAPGLHVLFGLDEDKLGYSLNDYLWGKCDITQTAHDATPHLGPGKQGKLFLIPSSIRAGEIARVLREGYDVSLLNDGFHDLIRELKLDVPRLVLVVNNVPEVFDPAEVRARVEATYKAEVAAVLPHSDDILALASAGIFALRCPDHPMTAALRQVATALMT